MSVAAKIKDQLESISSKVKSAEKAYGKQIKEALKKTEALRNDQLKKIQKIIKDAKSLKRVDLAKRADNVRSALESTASEGVDMLLKKLRVPSHKEIERLTKRVASLQKRVDELESRKTTK